jgi:hypothetical protein
MDLKYLLISIIGLIIGGLMAVIGALSYTDTPYGGKGFMYLLFSLIGSILVIVFLGGCISSIQGKFKI